MHGYKCKYWIDKDLDCMYIPYKAIPGELLVLNVTKDNSKVTNLEKPKKIFPLYSEEPLEDMPIKIPKTAKLDCNFEIVFKCKPTSEEPILYLTNSDCISEIHCINGTIAFSHYLEQIAYMDYTTYKMSDNEVFTVRLTHYPTTNCHKLLHRVGPIKIAKYFESDEPDWTIQSTANTLKQLYVIPHPDIYTIHRINPNPNDDGLQIILVPRRELATPTETVIKIPLQIVREYTNVDTDNQKLSLTLVPISLY